MKELPTYDECVAKVNRSEKLSAVELFIYGNEPGCKKEKDFRDGLLAALDEVAEEAYQDGVNVGIELGQLT